MTDQTRSMFKLAMTVVFLPLWYIWKIVDLICALPSVFSGIILIGLAHASGMREHVLKQELAKLTLIPGGQDWPGSNDGSVN
jgi:hypothetical protein